MVFESKPSTKTLPLSSVAGSPSSSKCTARRILSSGFPKWIIDKLSSPGPFFNASIPSSKPPELSV